MGTPSQDRAIDPFSSYASDNVNKLSRGVSKAQDGILTVSDLVVVADSTSSTSVTINPGFAYVSDVLLQVTSSHSLDFTQQSEYLAGTTLTADGYYHVVLSYDYAKSRPAPIAKIQIVDSDWTPHASLGDSLLFLAAVYVYSGAIISVHNYDPDNPTVKREYIKLDVSAEYDRPTFSATRDRGRILYETSVNKYWFGFEDRWEEISAGVSIDINTDATGLVVGSLAYIDSAGNAALADSTGGVSTRAEMVVLELGTTVTGNGRARLAGVIDEIQVDSASIVGIGDVIYLSPIEAGKCTNIKPTGIYQVIGRAMSAGSASTPIQALFFPGDLMATAISGSIGAGDWLYDGSAPYFYNYYYDVDISGLDLQYSALIINTWEASKLVDVSQVYIVDSGDTCRICQNASGTVIDYIISVGGGAGGSGAGGGGGSSAHNLLSNLDYASAGHTGFAPDPHNNFQHSVAYITASDVTYTALNATSSVGTGASQVAAGDHVHTAYDTVPSGSILIFRGTSVSGYNIVTEAWPYTIILGNLGSGLSAAEGAGTSGSGGTWTQPNCTLTLAQIPDHSHPYTRYAQALSGLDLTAGAGWANVTDAASGGATGHPGTTSPHAHDSTWRPSFIIFNQFQKI